MTAKQRIREIQHELLPLIEKSLKTGRYEYTGRRSLIIYSLDTKELHDLPFNAVEINWVHLKPPKAKEVI